MTHVDRALLREWPQLYLYPSVLVHIVREDGFDLRQVASQMLVDIAVQRGPREAVEYLISIGDLVAAEYALGSTRLRDVVSNEDYALLEDKLESAQLRLTDEVHGRMAALRARERRVGLEERIPTALIDGAVFDRRSVDEALDEWEDRIEAAEEDLAHHLTAQLDAIVVKRQSQEIGINPWRSAITSLIQAREFDVARGALDRGPVTPIPEYPEVIPRPREWPWREPLSEVIGWFRGTRPAPQGFRSTWGWLANDGAVAPLLDDLEQMAGEGIVTAEAASRFAQHLDAFLGYQVQEDTYPAADHGIYVESRLQGLRDPRLPVSLTGEDVGIPLRIPVSPNITIQDEVDETQQGLRLQFDPWERASQHDPVLSFDYRVLLALMGEPHNARINTLRYIGTHLPLEAAIPCRPMQLELAPLSPQDVHLYTRWLLDIHDIEIRDRSVIDVMVYYSGGSPRLLVRLVHQLLAEVGFRRVALDVTLVEQARRSNIFIQSARQELIEPLDADAASRCVLGAVIWSTAAPGGTTTQQEVLDALDLLWDVTMRPTDAARVFATLRSLGLVSSVLPDTYVVPTDGIGALLFDAVGDPGEFVEHAREELARP